MHNISLSRKRPLDRPTQKGQILIEGLFLMAFITSVLLVLAAFIKKQNEVFKNYELPAKIKYQKR